MGKKLPTTRRFGRKRFKSALIRPVSKTDARIGARILRDAGFTARVTRWDRKRYMIWRGAKRK